MFELVDITNGLISVEFETLAGALSRTRTSEWSGNPWNSGT